MSICHTKEQSNETNDLRHETTAQFGWFLSHRDSTISESASNVVLCHICVSQGRWKFKKHLSDQSHLVCWNAFRREGKVLKAPLSLSHFGCLYLVSIIRLAEVQLLLKILVEAKGEIGILHSPEVTHTRNRTVEIERAESFLWRHQIREIVVTKQFHFDTYRVSGWFLEKGSGTSTVLRRKQQSITNCKRRLSGKSP